MLCVYRLVTGGMDGSVKQWDYMSDSITFMKMLRLGSSGLCSSICICITLFPVLGKYSTLNRTHGCFCVFQNNQELESVTSLTQSTVIIGMYYLHTWLNFFSCSAPLRTDDNTF